MASFDYNPITGQLDLVGSGGGSYIDGEVEYHSNLPVTVGTPAVNSAFLVRKGEGLYFISRKPAGIWVRELNNGNLDDWKYAGTFSDLYRDANFRIINDADTSKELAFSLSGISTGTTRVLTAPDASGTIARTEDFAAPPAIGNTTPNSGAFTTLAANNGTLTASAPVLDLAQTWNNAGVAFTALRIDVTNTASSSVSFLQEWSTGGVMQAGIRNSGMLYLRSGRLASPVGAGWAESAVFLYNGISKINSKSLYIGDGGTGGPFILETEGADVMAQRRSTNPQTFRLYNTFTDASNYERGFMRWSSNVLQIGTEAAGTGSARALEFQTGGVTRFSISATAAVFNVGGGAFDAVIGRPNAGVMGFARADGATTYIAALGFDGTTRAFVANSAAFIGWSSGNPTSVTSGDTRLWRDAANVVAQRNGATGQTFRIYNADGTDFERLNLRWASNEFIIDAEQGGSGTLRGIKLGSATSSLLGFYGVTPVDQPATVADPTGGGTVDAEARTAINDIIDRLQELGLIA